MRHLKLMTLHYLFHLQDILSNSVVAVWLEVRPRYLIPDTNCFIDDLELIKAIANAHPLYQLMIPIVGKLKSSLELLRSFLCTDFFKVRLSCRHEFKHTMKMNNDKHCRYFGLIMLFLLLRTR